MTATLAVLTYSKLGDLLKVYKTPFFKYTGNVICFMVFVVLLLVNSAKHVTLIPSNLEVILSVWVFALAVGEVREAYRHDRYLADKWNQVDMLMSEDLVSPLSSPKHLVRSEATCTPKVSPPFAYHVSQSLTRLRIPAVDLALHHSYNLLGDHQ